MSNFGPGDVEVPQLGINGIDVRPITTRFSVFEHVMKPYTALTMDVVDSADVLNRLLNGSSDQLTISFGQPGQDKYSGAFAITSVERAKTLQNLRAKAYSITAYSRHMTKFPRVQRAFREMTATGIISSIVSEFLSPDKPVSVRDPSRGVLGDSRMPWNVNGVQVHKAIRSALSAAVSGSNSSSAYVFYEDKTSLVVDTLERMLGAAFESQKYTYYQRPMGLDWAADLARQNFVILSMRESSRTDRTDLYQTTNQQSNPFDVFSGVNLRTNVGSLPLVSTIANVLYNSMRPPTTIASAVPPKRTLASKLDSQSMTIQVPLNVELTAGAGVGVSLLAALGDTERMVQDSLSGPMMITELRHDVDFSRKRMQGTTTMTGSKGGMS